MEKYISDVIAPKVSIAPMVDKTVNHFRYFCRLLTKKTLLYTEMVTAQAIINGDRKKVLDFNPFEKPLALQISGSNPKEIYDAIKIAENWDYDEINLNVGCPSDRVSGNEMGAVLMAYPDLVREMVSEIRRATNKPVTVKHRIGIDGKNILPKTFDRTLLDKYEDMKNFVTIVEKAKVDRFTIHARIAILEGLSPKDNREILPIRYGDVYRLKRELPYLNIEINGGIKSIEDMEEHLRHVDGVMLGRVAFEDPFILTEVDKFFIDGEVNNISKREIIEKLIIYSEKMESQGELGYRIFLHTMGLFFGKRGSKQWRQITTPPWINGFTSRDILHEALKVIPKEVLDERPLDNSIN